MMRRRQLISLLLAAALGAGSSSMMTGCASTAPTVYSGRIVDDAMTIEAPSVPLPIPDLDAWQPKAASAIAASAASSAQTVASPVQAVTSLGKRSRVASMPVSEGDSVTAGQVVAVMDDALLQAALLQARAAAARSRDDVGVIEQRLDDVAEGRSTLADKRADLAATIGDLQRTRADLVSRRAEAKQALTQLEAIPLPPPGSVPPTLPPGAPNPDAIRANIAKLRAGIVQLDEAIAKIDAGLKKARAGLTKIDNARGDLNDARDQLRSLSTVAETGADAMAVGIAVAQARLDMATLRSPVDGVVVGRAPAGSVLAPGAAVVRVRPSSARKVVVWLPADDLRSITLGDRAEVRVDAFAEALAGHVTRIGTAADFPPTSNATSEIHLTRATEVEITLDSNEPLPAGLPADVVILTR